MSETVIRVENLSKKYIIGHQKQERYTALRDVLANQVKSIGQIFSRNGDKTDPTHEEFWALKDVSFEIKQGDRVGIIGRNGAGKSTLLKILSRITEPTSGKISIKGRVASLLEVGTGFHPELTGRENIYLNGAILGMDGAEIKKKFDEIVAFAEVEKFLDTPVKRYSSGMYVRLAFAVAAHLEPEILIVDEVLAVGDAKFQKKCLGKMQEVSVGGKTVLFVSHNMGAIESLCEKGILLTQGAVNFLGSAQEVISKYASENSTLSSGFVDLSERKIERYGPKNIAYIMSLGLLDNDGNPTSIVQMGQSVSFRLEIDFKASGEGLEIGIAVANLYNVSLHYLISNWENNLIIPNHGIHKIDVNLPHIQLFPGDYLVHVWVKQQGSAYDDAVHEALRFGVEEAQITPNYAYFQRYSHNTQVYTPSHWRLLN
jgi:lipopolysaccharide transport system ATP-binding protein